MLHEVYIFKKGEQYDFSKKQLMEWAEFRELLKKRETDTVIMRYNRQKNEWWKHEK